MTEHEDLIAEAYSHIDRAADAAPVSARQAILTGKVEDQRLSLVARLAHALEEVTAERDFFAQETSVSDHTATLARERAVKAEAERDAARRRNAELTRSSNEKNNTIDALAAVVDNALSIGQRTGYSHHKEPVMNALEEAPAHALDRVKAEAAVQALREAADGFRYCEDYGYRATRTNATENYLNARADRIEKGESNE